MEYSSFDTSQRLPFRDQKTIGIESSICYPRGPLIAVPAHQKASQLDCQAVPAHQKASPPGCRTSQQACPTWQSVILPLYCPGHKAFQTLGGHRLWLFLCDIPVYRVLPDPWGRRLYTFSLIFHAIRVHAQTLGYSDSVCFMSYSMTFHAIPRHSQSLV